MAKLYSSYSSSGLCTYCMNARELSWSDPDNGAIEMRACPRCTTTAATSTRLQSGLSAKAAMEAAVAAMGKVRRE